MSLRIRLATTSDAEELLTIYDYYVTHTAITFDYQTPSLAEFTAKLQAIQKTYPYLVALDGDQVLGYAYASAFHPRPAYQWLAETSIYLAPDERGRGVGLALYQALEESMRQQGILRSMACIATTTSPDQYLSNASLGFHEHLGYEVVGQFNQSGYKFDRWYDMKWLEKNLAQKPENPQPILPFWQTQAFKDYKES